MSNWCTIESDPGVFSELIAKAGVKNVLVEELVSLDEEFTKKLGKTHGLVFLFKYLNESDSREVVPFVPGLFFAKQTISNACGTLALLQILMNADGVELGEELQNFKDFTGELPPEMKGHALDECEIIKTAHNSFAKADPFIAQATKDDEEGEAFHFVSYIPFEGKLYELDGLREGAICLGDYSDDWVNDVRPFIQERMENYQKSGASEIRFNLLAVGEHRGEVAKRDLEELTETISELKETFEAMKEAGDMVDEEDKEEQEMALAVFKEELEEMSLRETELKSTIEEVDDMCKRWKTENARRKHNYVPLFTAVMEKLAEKRKLIPMLEKAKTSVQARIMEQIKAKHAAEK
eukprot:TRINITY_DN774419_c0_g1_i1.p1 TRINITY_DN774419_c0_g1~~TRINITY_DN774419_c0_g1_i1.p1  ORF type:complete len:364 (-),score=129.83 TRINITY_DN774419_c0_g1_i1:159-1211(-)